MTIASPPTKEKLGLNQLALDVAATFATGPGERTLAWLEQSVCGMHRPVFHGEHFDALRAAFADGRRSVFLEIEAKIKHASHVLPE